MILQERGKLNTHDNARKYMPDYNELDERITIHHLLTHTSGLQYLFAGETESEGNDYGYGWFIEEKFGRNRISHGGGGLGFITEFHRYDSEELSIIVFSNYGFTAVMRIIDIIAAFMLEEKVAFPNKPPIYELESGVFDRYIGTYKNDIEKFTVYQDKGKMYFMIDDEYVIPIFPVSPTNFHHTWIDESYTFYKDDNDDLCFCGAKKMI